MSDSESSSVSPSIDSESSQEDVKLEINGNTDPPSPTGDERASLKKSTKQKKARIASALTYADKLSKRGVMYISRLPPKMTVSKVKTLLSHLGTVTRLYLEEEDKTVRKRRKRAGGSSSKRYVCGWAEFPSRSQASNIAESIHQTQMERKGPHRDDLWSVRYLRGFKWEMLTEKVAYERRVREQKLRVEMVNAKREIRDFKEKVEEGGKFDMMVQKNKVKGKKEKEKEGGEGKGKRKFRQIKAMPDDGE
jgi:ESF2/ABP1 family protein